MDTNDYYFTRLVISAMIHAANLELIPEFAPLTRLKTAQLLPGFSRR